MPATASLVREALCAFFHEQSLRRGAKSSQTSLDERHKRSACALEQMSAFIAALPDGDPTLRRLAALDIILRNGEAVSLFAESWFWAPQMEQLADTSPECLAESFDCGFSEPLLSPAAWFAKWAETIERDAANTYDTACVPSDPEIAEGIDLRATEGEEQP